MLNLNKNLLNYINPEDTKLNLLFIGMNNFIIPSQFFNINFFDWSFICFFKAK